ncbi:SDR family NAD(P)-dependent oxidoreductase [uncultured Erythrobacter sp.]|uniref:SDR family NAD(P)-dependent oxidoreductase n=1 Tax=uncultured Erythrobacter sp. TaxID=263913 RepID=UPI00262B72E0|nr:SDR family NAD(P)-dependent oxidoreductase [uncultured Erythrobacter sp.]
MEPYQPLSRSIAGHRAIVTGAASGMGRATAHLFASEGAHVAVTDLDQAKCEAVAKEIAEAGYSGSALPLSLDVTDETVIEARIKEITESFGGLDIIVNNAGFAIHSTIEDESYPGVWDKSVAAMLTAHQRIIRAAIPHLRKSSAARIVNIASTEGLGATPGNSPYVAAKHGVIGLTRGLAVDLGRDGITVNCICPGPIRTGITEAIPDEHKEIYAKRRVPLRRYGIPEEVAHMTLSLVLPAAQFVTGVAIPVDGGLTIKNA